MGNYGFEVDTSLLKRDKDSFETCLKQLKKEAKKLEEQMTAVSAMWEGPAKDAFYVRYHDDNQEFLELCRKLEENLEQMEAAADAYRYCDAAVENIIHAVWI